MSNFWCVTSSSFCAVLAPVTPRGVTVSQETQRGLAFRFFSGCPNGLANRQSCNKNTFWRRGSYNITFLKPIISSVISISTWIFPTSLHLATWSFPFHGLSFSSEGVIVESLTEYITQRAPKRIYDNII